MVEILCPHCGGDIELEDGASGDFECQHCGGEFEWGKDSKTTPKSSTGPMSGVTALSHCVHALGAILLIVSLFTSWVVVLGGVIGITPFGVGSSRGSETLGWFEIFSVVEGREVVISLAGMLLMLLAIIAVISQIIHIAFRVIVHMTESDSLEISMEMLYRAHKYRWHSSLTALICTGISYLLVQIGTLISFGVEAGFPRPSFFLIVLLGVLIGQVYLMHEEGLIEQ